MFEEVGSTTEFYKSEGDYAAEFAFWLQEREQRLHNVQSKDS